MAKITHPSLFRFANFQPGLRKKVGNNREVLHVRCAHEEQIMGLLHGHPVFMLTRPASYCSSQDAVLYLDTCGHMTATTVAAMRDFCEAAGFLMGVSRTGGVLTAWRYDRPGVKHHGGRQVSLRFEEA